MQGSHSVGFYSSVGWAQVVIINCHKLGGLSTTEVYLSLFWMLRVQDHGGGMAGSGESSLPGCRWLSFHRTPIWQKERESALRPLLIWVLIPLMRPHTHDLIMFPEMLLRISSHQGFSFNIWILWGCDHSVHNKYGFSSLTSSHLFLTLNLMCQITTGDSKACTAFGVRSVKQECYGDKIVENH